MQISAADYKNAETVCRHLENAAKSMRILSNLNWSDTHRQAFLKNGTLPNPEYKPVDTKTCFEQLKIARAAMSTAGPLSEWLERIAMSVELTARLLESRGTPAFFDYSVQLYGQPNDTLIDRHTRVLDMAEHMEDTLAGLDVDKLVLRGYEVFLTPREFAQAIRPRLKRYFDTAAPKVQIVDDLSAKVTAGSKRIRIRSDAQFTGRDVEQLLQHEALVHTATALNGQSQPHFPILGLSLARVTQIQEGLAVFAEMMSGAMDPRRIRRLVDRVLAIQMSIDGADFKDIYDFYLERTDDPDLSYDNARRIFRGAVMTGGAPFTKDMVYLNGLLRVHNFMRTVVSLQRADLIRLLFVGKMDLEDVPVLAQMAHDGWINTANFMPSWAKDLRFLVSYLGYSSFLNQVKLPGFQAYYEQALANVPVIWEATEATA